MRDISVADIKFNAIKRGASNHHLHMTCRFENTNVSLWVTQNSHNMKAKGWWKLFGFKQCNIIPFCLYFSNNKTIIANNANPAYVFPAVLKTVNQAMLRFYLFPLSFNKWRDKTRCWLLPSNATITSWNKSFVFSCSSQICNCEPDWPQRVSSVLLR